MDTTCEKCKRVFDMKSHLKYHIDNNSCKDVNYKCKLCNKGFTTKTSMYRHLRGTCKVKIEDNKVKIEDNKVKIKYDKKKDIHERLNALEENNRRLVEINVQMNNMVIANEKKQIRYSAQLKNQITRLEKIRRESG